MATINVDEKTGEFNISLVNFSGGLNTRDIDSKIKDDELSDVRNFTYDRLGALTVRGGQIKVITSNWDAGAIKSGIGYYKTGASPKAVVTGGTKIGYINSLKGVTDIKISLTGDGLFFDMHQFVDKLFMTNGIDPCQVYTGGEVHDIGYPVPTSNCTIADGGAGGLLSVGTYKYKVTNFYEDGESNECVATNSQALAASHKMTLTFIPLGNTRVTQRRIYRTVADGVVYKLLTVINDNITAGYTDNIPDNGLGADIETDNVIPPVFDFCVSHKGRMWYAVGTTLWYSKALKPEAVSSLYYWDVGKGDGDEITCIKVNLGALVISKKYSTWVITGDLPTGTSADMILENVNPTIGCISFNTVTHAGNDLLFMTPNLGVHRLHRIILATTDSMDAEPISDKISTTIKSLNGTYTVNSYAECYNHKYYLGVPSANSTTNDLCLVLDLTNMDTTDESTIKWTIYDNYYFSNAFLYLDTAGEHLYGLSNVLGHASELEKGVNDDGALIIAYAVTKNYDFGSFLQSKVPRLLAAQGRASEDYEFTVRTFLQYRNTLYQKTKTFTGGGVASTTDVLYDDIIYDSVLYDTDGTYIGTVLDFTKTAHLTQPFNTIKFKVEDVSANQQFAFYGFLLKGFLGLLRPMK